MADNIFEQLVLENNELLVFNTRGTLDDQAKSANRLAAKIDRNNFDNATQAITYIAAQKNAAPTQTIDESVAILRDNQKTIKRDTSSYLSESEKSNDIVAAASRIEYKVSEAVENVYVGSTAKEIYDFKRDPNAIVNRVNYYEILNQEAERYTNRINYINNTNSNTEANLQAVQDILK